MIRKPSNPNAGPALRLDAETRKKIALGAALQATAFLQTARNAMVSGRERDEIAGMLDEALQHLQRARRNT